MAKFYPVSFMKQENGMASEVFKKVGVSVLSLIKDLESILSSQTSVESEKVTTSVLKISSLLLLQLISGLRGCILLRKGKMA